ncbi:MAG: sodium/glutamate symporter [Candidatus Brocadiia bacterium]
MAIVPSFVGLCLLLLVGHALRTRVRLVQKLYLPSAVIGGLVGLAAVQLLVGEGKAVSPMWIAGWERLPGFLINIVFACLFLGVRLPKVSTIWARAGHQVVYGQLVAWGQYVVGVGLVVLWLGGLFGLPDMFGGVLPVGFEGGHGTASGLAETFEKLGWAAGKDFALASATGGIISAIVVGMMLINWAARRGHTVRRLSPADVPEDDSIGIIPVDRRPSAGRLTVRSDSIESFTLHVAIVGLAVALGYVLKQGLVALEALVAPEAEQSFMESFPLFPLCMLGGLVVQILEEKFDRHKLLDVGLTRRIQNSALDFLVVAAIATINLQVIGAGWLPLVVLIAAGVLWNVFCLLVLAPRLLPDAWFERAIAEMGQSMGVTATGLLLLRVVDPDYESPAADAFACKQLVHEPFLGGGLWTSTAIPLLYFWGGPTVLAIAAGAVAFWFVVACLARLARRRGGAAQDGPP